MLPLFSLPKRAPWTTLFILGCFIWLSILLEWNLNCRHPFVDCFLFVSHYWGHYSIYFCSSPCMFCLASISLLGCCKAPAMALYVYLTVEANTVIKWKVNLSLNYSTVIRIWSRISLEHDHSVKLYYVSLFQVLIYIKTLSKMATISSHHLSFYQYWSVNLAWETFNLKCLTTQIQSKITR